MINWTLSTVLTYIGKGKPFFPDVVVVVLVNNPWMVEIGEAFNVHLR